MAKRYRGGVRALDGIDLDIPVGSITALVGPNGAGKSTLMKAWVGFERPNAGSVAVLGVDPWRDRGAALDRLGYVPQRPALYRGLSVADHVALAVSLRPGFDAASRGGDSTSSTSRSTRTRGRCRAASRRRSCWPSRSGPMRPCSSSTSPWPASIRSLAASSSTSSSTPSGPTARPRVLSSHVITDIEQACDRIVVLGAGHKILDESIAAALAAHWVADGDPSPPTGASRVAVFPGPLGEPMSLWRLDGEAVVPPDFRRATLEELVLGRLASSRPQRRSARPSADAA